MMTGQFLNLTAENLAEEHLCCAISDKKHQEGVEIKKQWLKERISEGHIFRKLAEKGKVFIEYAPLEKSWVPVVGENYIYIYCLWVAGKFKDHGYGKALLEYCINDAKSKGKAGICVISSPKKKPFLSDKKFFVKYGFEVVDRIDNQYELLALSFDGSKVSFLENAKKGEIDNKELTIYYGIQCPFIPNCIKEIKEYSLQEKLPVSFIKVDTLAKAKNVPCVFNNWAVFNDGKFQSLQLLNEGSLKKLLSVSKK